MCLHIPMRRIIITQKQTAKTQSVKYSRKQQSKNALKKKKVKLRRVKNLLEMQHNIKPSQISF